MRSCSPCVVLVLMAAAATVTAQTTTDFQAVDSPFHEQLPFQLGEPLRPGVVVAGVRWHQLSLTPRDEGEVPPEEEVPVVTELVLENVAEGSARVLVILLLEDDDHNALQRLELEPVKVRPERLVEESQKSKVLGSALLQATGVYVFVEVER